MTNNLSTTITKLFSISLFLLITAGLSIAQETSSGNGSPHRLVGTWVATVTIRNCQTGTPIISIPALNTFNQGGTMLETAQSLANRSAGLGIWKRTGRNEFISVFLFRRVNPDGTNNGFQKIRRTHELDDDTLTTEATFEIFDANGVLVSTGCATETADRLEFE